MKNKEYINFRTDMVVSNIENKAIEVIARAIKTKLTIPIKVTSNSIEYLKYISLLKKIDNKFRKHTVEIDGRYYVDAIFTINTKKNSMIIVYGYPQIGNMDNKSDIFYTLDMYIVGINSLNILKTIQNYIQSKTNKSTDSTIPLFEISGSANGWVSIKSFIDKRGFDTMFFDNNIKEEILDHINNWEKCADVFEKRGLTHKTGILIYGKPGTGKSTLAKALASELNYNLISIDSSTFDDINLIELTNAINNDNMKSVIFIDEIDAIFKSREDEETTDDQKARVNKLLSFLDGINSPNHSIFVATTNYYNNLDAAIKRKGRFDKIIELTDINKNTAFKMCKSFDLSDESCNNIISSYKTKSINPADLQEKIISCIRKELVD